MLGTSPKVPPHPLKTFWGKELFSNNEVRKNFIAEVFANQFCDSFGQAFSKACGVWGGAPHKHTHKSKINHPIIKHRKKGVKRFWVDF
jgi:hypothetical protein